MKRQLLLFVLLAAGFSACSPKNTASFGPSQKFYKPVQQKEVSGELLTTADEVIHIDRKEFKSEERELAEASASSKLISTVQSKTRSEKIVEKYAKSGVPSTKEVLKLPARQRIKVLKEVKKDIKALKKVKKDKSIENRKVYVGIIIALAGLVIAILASGAIGALGIIVGVVLIAWGLIEQGSI
ncbi:MAG: hypothetical protein AAGA02_01135 [Bacteroidota bacterium]